MDVIDMNADEVKFAGVTLRTNGLIGTISWAVDLLNCTEIGMPTEDFLEGLSWAVQQLTSIHLQLNERLCLGLNDNGMLVATLDF